MEYKKKQEKKTKVTSVRFRQSTYNGVQKSDYTIDEMCEYFLMMENDQQFELLKLKETKIKQICDLESKRTDLEIQLQNIDDTIANLKLDIKDINKSLHNVGYDVATYKQQKALDNSIQKTLDYYIKSKASSFDEMLMIKRHEIYVKGMATRCGHDYDEFINIMKNKITDADVQQVIV